MIQIVSDGTSEGTKVLDAEGRPLKGLISATWAIDVGGKARAYLTFADVKVDLKAEDESIPSSKDNPWGGLR